MRASFKFEGSKTLAYCEQDTKEGMDNALTKRGSQAFCTTRATCNVGGSKTVAYCKKHAPEDILCVHGKRSSHGTCAWHRARGIAADGAATVCARHGNDLLDSPVIRLNAQCEVPGCRKYSSLGLHGKQPTHCRDDGSLSGDLVHCSGMDSSKGRLASSVGALEGPSLHVKTESFF